jgi:hypothetical protein
MNKYIIMKIFPLLLMLLYLQVKPAYDLAMPFNI